MTAVQKKEGRVYGGKDLWNSLVLSRGWNNEGVMNGKSGESTYKDDLTSAVWDESDAKWPGRRGATTFSKLGVQFLGLGYCTEQNTDGIANFVHCSVQLRKKLGWSVQILGVRTPRPPSGCALARTRLTERDVRLTLKRRGPLTTM